jgi:hypothetical protein
VAPGGSVTYSLNVAPVNGAYAGTVTFAVSGLPPGATSTFSPSSIAANAGPQIVTMTIQTAASTATAQPPSPPSGGRHMAPISLAFLLLFGTAGMRRRGRNLKRLLGMAILFVGGAAATLTLNGCAANGFFAQPPQNDTVTITTTSGSVQHSTAVTLNLQ